MKKEYSPEMYNYNKYPGPNFVRLEQLVKSDGISLTILEDIGEAFDTEVFSQRFSEFLLKYDYIVGDWGNDQLRLKGFYQNNKKKPNHWKISRLQDYLKEYCNFGCRYFVLENPEPRELVVDEEVRLPKRRRRRSSRKGSKTDNYQDNSSVDYRIKKKNRSRKSFPSNKTKTDGDSGSRGHFTIRQKG